DAEREDRHLRQVAAREHVIQAEHRVLRLIDEYRQRLRIDSRSGNVPADAVYREQTEREQHALPQVRDRENVLEAVCQHRTFLIGSGPRLRRPTTVPPRYRRLPRSSPPPCR